MQGCSRKIPQNVIEIPRDFADRLDQGNTLRFFLGLLLFLCPNAGYTEGIGEAPSPIPMSEEAMTYQLGEDMYQRTLSWQNDKASSKFNQE